MDYFASFAFLKFRQLSGNTFASTIFAELAQVLLIVCQTYKRALLPDDILGFCVSFSSLGIICGS